MEGLTETRRIDAMAVGHKLLIVGGNEGQLICKVNFISAFKH